MGLVYDFDFVELAIRFIETSDAKYIEKISETDAAAHILNHALRFGYDVPTGSTLELVMYLLTPLDRHKENLPLVVRNLEYVKKHIANGDAIEKIVLELLPEGFSFDGSLFFTFGYDIGVAFGNNCSLNLAHPIFLKNMNELKYYAIHELHHVGFIAIKGYMPSLEISTRGEMALLIEYLTHLEGMGVYAPLSARVEDSAMGDDGDYIALRDCELLSGLIEEYFDVYRYFKNHPSELLVEDDWHKVGTLSDGKRLWYVVGAHMARAIDCERGRDCLVGLICGSSEKFIVDSNVHYFQKVL